KPDKERAVRAHAGEAFHANTPARRAFLLSRPSLRPTTLHPQPRRHPIGALVAEGQTEHDLPPWIRPLLESVREAAWSDGSGLRGRGSVVHGDRHGRSRPHGSP